MKKKSNIIHLGVVFIKPFFPHPGYHKKWKRWFCLDARLYRNIHVKEDKKNIKNKHFSGLKTEKYLLIVHKKTTCWNIFFLTYDPPPAPLWRPEWYVEHVTFFGLRATVQAYTIEFPNFVNICKEPKGNRKKNIFLMAMPLSPPPP